MRACLSTCNGRGQADQSKNVQLPAVEFMQTHPTVEGTTVLFRLRCDSPSGRAGGERKACVPPWLTSPAGWQRFALKHAVLFWKIWPFETDMEACSSVFPNSGPNPSVQMGRRAGPGHDTQRRVTRNHWPKVTGLPAPTGKHSGLHAPAPAHCPRIPNRTTMQQAPEGLAAVVRLTPTSRTQHKGRLTLQLAVSVRQLLLLSIPDLSLLRVLRLRWVQPVWWEQLLLLTCGRTDRPTDQRMSFGWKGRSGRCSLKQLHTVSHLPPQPTQFIFNLTTAREVIKKIFNHLIDSWQRANANYLSQLKCKNRPS